MYKNQKHSKETKERISIALRGENNPSKRPEVREKLRLDWIKRRESGWINPCKGRKLQDENVREKIRLSKMGDKNPSWKGDKVKYNALHVWVRKNKPKSMFCEKCGTITSELDASNISGEYKRDISDYRWLCRGCHIEEDGNTTNFKVPKVNESWENNKFK